MLHFDTFYFWDPTFKWGINIANSVADLSKPPEKLSYPQQIGAIVCLLFFMGVGQGSEVRGEKAEAESFGA
ncbi:hypothetical protein QN277_005622 [Acacia crassicarpa]|uniref:Mitochondrial pyruvate carrier n=1 Tax=Acacia crassicarpa TaxID=499986 RepID=A0AAE1IWS4_9FABA|nr:hypothetical protein QN277_005622 [Acacia crassicarpa]